MRTCTITIDDEQRSGRDWTETNASSNQVQEAIGKLDATTYVDLRIEVVSNDDGETEMVIRCVIVGYDGGLLKPENPEYLYVCSAADENYNWSNLRQRSSDEATVDTWTNSEGVSELPRSWLTTREQVSEAARVFVDEGRLAEIDNCQWA